MQALASGAVRRKIVSRAKQDFFTITIRSLVKVWKLLLSQKSPQSPFKKGEFGRRLPQGIGCPSPRVIGCPFPRVKAIISHPRPFHSWHYPRVRTKLAASFPRRILASPCGQENNVRAEFLDAVITAISHIDIAAAIHGYSTGGGE